MLRCVWYIVNIQQVTAAKAAEWSGTWKHGPTAVFGRQNIQSPFGPEMLNILLLSVYKESDSWLFEVRTDNSRSWPQQGTSEDLL